MTHPTLIVTGGPLDGTVFVVDGTQILMGSSSDCQIQVLLGNVEPFHAKLTRNPRGLLLSDGGSATGTYVNGEKIGADHLLSDGDRICLGPPGSKGSAKMLVRLPPGGGGLSAGTTASDESEVVDTDAEPLVLVK
ncbi:MAG TPA: FHA domain-containing protein, partial [Vicinamibacteria bacterium]|nr:FHA domain-containing protein [Vicinamibacteria bacterium]